MKANILTEFPFIIPVGTKIRFTFQDGTTKDCFFAGYKTLGLNVLKDKFDFFPLFKKVKKDGTESRANIDTVAGALSDFELREIELTVLDENKVDMNKINFALPYLETIAFKNELNKKVTKILRHFMKHQKDTIYVRAFNEERSKETIALRLYGESFYPEIIHLQDDRIIATCVTETGVVHNSNISDENVPSLCRKDIIRLLDLTLRYLEEVERGQMPLFSSQDEEDKWQNEPNY